jgi:uncharacterized membrane protein YgcG
MRRSIFATAALIALWLAGAGTAGAQDLRWSPWLGCWTPSDAQRRSQDIQICIVPNASGSGVRMITLAGEQTLLDESIVANGSPEKITESDCSSTRMARWATRAARLLSVGERQCTDHPLERSSSVSTLTGANEWLDVQVAGVVGREGVRIRRYTRSTGEPPSAVADMIRALPREGPATDVRPSVPTVDDVIEANGAVSSRAVEVWLAETEPAMAIDRRALVKLTENKVSEPVIDLLVALAYPQRFEVRRPVASASGGGGMDFIDEGFVSPWDTSAGPWSLNPYSLYYAPFLPWGAYDLYSFYSPYDGGFIIGGGVITPPIAETHGRVVNGLGYTQIEPHVEATTRGGDGSGAGAGSSSSGGAGSDGGSFSGGASPGGYSSGGGGSTGLTAVPR